MSPRPLVPCTALGKRIRQLKLKKGQSQTEFAESLGINRGHLSDLEHGKRETGITTLQVIARGLDTTMGKLLRGL